MENKSNLRLGLAALSCLLVFNLFIGTKPNLADEGMWTFDNPPVKLLKERYDLLIGADRKLIADRNFDFSRSQGRLIKSARG